MVSLLKLSNTSKLKNLKSYNLLLLAIEAENFCVDDLHQKVISQVIRQNRQLVFRFYSFRIDQPPVQKIEKI